MEAFNALSDAARKVQDQEALNKAALESGQRWGIVHLYGQKRLGEITREMPKAQSIAVRDNETGMLISTLPSAIPGKQAALAASNITSHQASDAERIAAHPEILERVIAQSKEEGFAPRPSDVLKQIKAEAYKANVLDKIKEEAPDINEVANSIACKLGEVRVKIMKIWEHKDMLSDINIDGIRNAIEDIYDIVMED